MAQNVFALYHCYASLLVNILYFGFTNSNSRYEVDRHTDCDSSQSVHVPQVGVVFACLLM